MALESIHIRDSCMIPFVFMNGDMCNAWRITPVAELDILWAILSHWVSDKMTDGVFKCISVNTNHLILIRVSSKLAPKESIGNISMMTQLSTLSSFENILKFYARKFSYMIRHHTRKGCCLMHRNVTVSYNVYAYFTKPCVVKSQEYSECWAIMDCWCTGGKCEKHTVPI